jgi:transposase
MFEGQIRSLRRAFTSCPRSMSRFSPLLWSSLHRLLVLARIGASSWYKTLAGWHSSQMLGVPDGIHLVFLPPYSPELQPCERLWPLTNEAITNRHFKTLDELQEVQAQRCVTLQNNPIGIHHITFAPAGGLPCPHKRDLSGSKPLFPQTLLFVSLAHLRDISLRS